MNLNISENIRMKKMGFIFVMQNVNSVNILYVLTRNCLIYFDYNLTTLLLNQCTLPYGHAQIHDTRHGNMIQTEFTGEEDEFEFDGYDNFKSLS